MTRASLSPTQLFILNGLLVRKRQWSIQAFSLWSGAWVGANIDYLGEQIGP